MEADHRDPINHHRERRAKVRVTKQLRLLGAASTTVRMITGRGLTVECLDDTVTRLASGETQGEQSDA